MRFASKYRAKPMELDGIRFASQKEARRYAELKLLVKIGRIRDLVLQPKYPLHIVKLYRNGLPIEIATVATYIGDFEYIECDGGEIVTEDTKGFKTETYRLKKKIGRCDSWRDDSGNVNMGAWRGAISTGEEHERDARNACCAPSTFRVRSRKQVPRKPQRARQRVCKSAFLGGQMLKLSEAIRLGSMLRPQEYGRAFRGGRSCALGAALEASGTAYNARRLTVDTVIAKRWAWADEPTDQRACPACGTPSYECAGLLIVHLNDDHRWTREQIAEWVSTIEPQDAATTDATRELAQVVSTL